MSWRKETIGVLSNMEKPSAWKHSCVYTNQSVATNTNRGWWFEDNVVSRTRHCRWKERFSPLSYKEMHRSQSGRVSLFNKTMIQTELSLCGSHHTVIFLMYIADTSTVCMINTCHGWIWAHNDFLEPLDWKVLHKTLSCTAHMVSSSHWPQFCISIDAGWSKSWAVSIVSFTPSLVIHLISLSNCRLCDSERSSSSPQ